MPARIFRPAPNAMQSGRGNSRLWVLVHELNAAKDIEPLMGYTSSTDTRQQIRLTFDTLEEAKAYAERNGIPYSYVSVPRGQSVIRDLAAVSPAVVDTLRVATAPQN